MTFRIVSLEITKSTVVLLQISAPVPVLVKRSGKFLV